MMKKIIFIISIAFCFLTGSCENVQRGIQDPEIADRIGSEHDSLAVEKGSTDERKRGLADDQGSNDDFEDAGGEHNALLSALPQEVVQKIRADENLTERQLTNTRSFQRDGTTYYELTFDTGDTIFLKIFDLLTDDFNGHSLAGNLLF